MLEAKGFRGRRTQFLPAREAFQILSRFSPANPQAAPNSAGLEGMAVAGKLLACAPRRKGAIVTMTYTFDLLREKYPAYSDDAIREAVRLLNTPPAAVREIWAGEDRAREMDWDAGSNRTLGPSSGALK